MFVATPANKDTLQNNIPLEKPITSGLPFLFFTPDETVPSIPNWTPIKWPKTNLNAEKYLIAAQSDLEKIPCGGTALLPQKPETWLPLCFNKEDLTPQEAETQDLYKNTPYKNTNIFDQIQKAKTNYYKRNNKIWRIKDKDISFNSPIFMTIWNIYKKNSTSIEDTRDYIQTILNEKNTDILDIGAQSTNPWAQQNPTQEELELLKKQLPWAIQNLNYTISVDTYREECAQYAAQMGAHIINDVGWRAELGETTNNSSNILTLAQLYKHPSSFKQYFEPTIQCLKKHNIGYILTHTYTHSTPNISYQSLLQDSFAFFATTLSTLYNRGIDLRRIALDLGLGFGKGMENDLKLLCAAKYFEIFGCPILIGYSNKRFLKFYTQKDENSCELLNTIAGTMALQTGANILRIHNPKDLHDARILFEKS